VPNSNHGASIHMSLTTEVEKDEAVVPL